MLEEPLKKDFEVSPEDRFYYFEVSPEDWRQVHGITFFISINVYDKQSWRMNLGTLHISAQNYIQIKKWNMVQMAKLDWIKQSQLCLGVHRLQCDD